MHPTKSITERVCQALGFEGLALLICTPLLVWITGRPALEMGAVTLGLSLLALTWNIIFNSLFRNFFRRLEERSNIDIKSHICKCCCHYFCASIVTVLSHFCHHYSWSSSFLVFKFLA